MAWSESILWDHYGLMTIHSFTHFLVSHVLCMYCAALFTQKEAMGSIRHYAREDTFRFEPYQFQGHLTGLFHVCLYVLVYGIGGLRDDNKTWLRSSEKNKFKSSLAKGLRAFYFHLGSSIESSCFSFFLSRTRRALFLLFLELRSSRERLFFRFAFIYHAQTRG